MLQKLGTGLFVVELMGQGVNYVTGDYSRGASGFWVENGKIAFPVHEITIAGNPGDMLKGIEAVGADAYSYGAKTVGSILVNRMKVAGAADTGVRAPCKRPWVSGAFLLSVDRYEAGVASAISLISGARGTERFCAGVFSLPQCARQSPHPPGWCWPCRPGRACAGRS